MDKHSPKSLAATKLYLDFGPRLLCDSCMEKPGVREFQRYMERIDQAKLDNFNIDYEYFDEYCDKLSTIMKILGHPEVQCPRCFDEIQEETAT